MTATELTSQLTTHRRFRRLAVVAIGLVIGVILIVSAFTALTSNVNRPHQWPPPPELQEIASHQS
jgi:uncharacterized membrane protein